MFVWFGGEDRGALLGVGQILVWMYVGVKQLSLREICIPDLTHSISHVPYFLHCNSSFETSELRVVAESIPNGYHLRQTSLVDGRNMSIPRATLDPHPSHDPRRRVRSFPRSSNHRGPSRRELGMYSLSSHCPLVILALSSQGSVLLPLIPEGEPFLMFPSSLTPLLFFPQWDYPSDAFVCIILLPFIKNDLLTFD